MLQFSTQNDTLVVSYDRVRIITHSAQHPCIVLRHANETIDMYRGNYFIEDAVVDEIALTSFTLAESYQEGKAVSTLTFFSGDVSLSLHLMEEGGRLQMRVTPLSAPYNRLIIRVHAEEDEYVWGCGEQFSYFNLRGKNFPLWTQEQGVGRNKNTAITKIADELDRAGGDYHTTFYPQPTFISSRGYFLHSDSDGYADYDFSDPHSHQLLFWELPSLITISVQASLLALVQDVSALLGRQGLLPDWVYDGIILGMQGGTDLCLEKIEAMEAVGTKIAGSWIQDWQGEKYTSFGKRLRWNWQWDPVLYPKLDEAIIRLHERGIRVLGYINPYVLVDHPLYEEAKALDLLGTGDDGSPFLVDFGEFDAAVVDFTKEEAVTWYKQVIRREMIDFGLSGWMADFGEYLPTTVSLASRRGAVVEHNPWPGYWAKVNHDAIHEAGAEDEILFFMRAGSTASLKYCQMMWAGDQNVDWSEDDGLPSVITAALSLSMSGMGLHHSDIGGYTTLYGMKRSKELLIRWAEFAAFTPLMRTHEGNRPRDNWQFDSDEETMRSIARMTDVHVQLKGYIKHLVAENAQRGIPVMRPIFLHYDEERFYATKDAYLLGSDMLVAPILEEGARRRSVVLPDDQWVHLLTKEEYSGGEYVVEAPLLCPPVFFRKESAFRALFSSVQ
ncbi:MAG TPA: alpha-glucosidase [Sphaerochaeta sp.]|nr:alpha-glucosidase [Sphaerochaeta sp.]HQB89990.1 alpha-glucosidase [Sphaerochaeta sp.]